MAACEHGGIHGHVSVVYLVLELGDSRTSVPIHLCLLAQWQVKAPGRRSQNTNLSYPAVQARWQTTHVRCHRLQRVAMVAASSSLARHVHQASWALRNVGFAVGLINGWSDRISNYLADAKYTSTPLDPRHRAERASSAIATPPHQRPHEPTPFAAEKTVRFEESLG
jgi:hypothetical protein